MTDLKGRLPLWAVEIAFALLVLAWTVVGFLTRSGVDPLHLGVGLYGEPRVVPFALTTAAAGLLAALCLFKLASPFVAQRLPFAAAPERAGSILLDVVASVLVLALVTMHLSARAASAAYFSVLPPLDYAAAAGALVFNAWSLARLIGLVSLRDAMYREYLEFRRQAEAASGNVLQLLLRAGIQKKLIISFTTLILVVIIVLATVLMRGFSHTILKAVIDNGSSLTDRAASVIKANVIDNIAIADYFLYEQKKNAKAGFPFRSLTYYSRSPGSDAMVASQSTDPAQLKRPVPEGYRGAREPDNRYNAARGTFEFVAPVILSNVLVGEVLVDYDRDLIYEPYFRTQVRVILVAALFVYASVFAIYIFGNNIVFPILFLRMSVNRISGTLAGMIRGRTRISAELLQYDDRVPTRDEIKMLSDEIGNMTTVIKGIIPYISASTLKHSERNTPTSQSRQLAFLFTDIRGFTTLCEGMSPPQIVEILNHYLDLQAQVIIQHHGDIDKFVGDEVMGQFDGPTREINACRAAMAIRTAMARDKELKEAEKRNLISIGIGINTGPVVFGSVGSKDRMDFTSIGDTVNLAARLEGANKEYGTKSLVSEAVYDKVKDTYLCREIDLLTVKGKTQPVRIYEILQERDKAAPKLVTLAESFEKALAYYRGRKWDAASKVFQTLVDKLHDDPSRVFLGRIEHFQANPPPRGWDGVFAMTVK
jgi:adenylate cyclase